MGKNPGKESDGILDKVISTMEKQIFKIEHKCAAQKYSNKNHIN